MPKKFNPIPTKQLLFRVPPDIHQTIMWSADALGLDVSNFLRLVIAEHIPEYVERGKKIRAAIKAARKLIQPAKPPVSPPPPPDGGPPPASTSTDC